MSLLSHLNYLHILIASVVGFVFGWLWYSVLFGKAWAAEMKIPEEKMKDCKSGMGASLVKGFICTFVSTVGLAMLLALHPFVSWVKGAELGAAVGLLLVGARFLNIGIWEQRSCKLQAINLWHEVLLFALQGAVLVACS